MMMNFALGVVMMILNLGIQLVAVTLILRFIQRHLDKRQSPGFAVDIGTLSAVMAVLIIGHGFMFATWALLFQWLGEFEDFATAFYHSTVNFTSLGYGDIVMSEEHRLLGALEAANGVLMFGLTAGSILAVMNFLFQRAEQFKPLKERLGKKA
jgi:voltage-gated potassium channel Kch